MSASKHTQTRRRAPFLQNCITLYIQNASPSWCRGRENWEWGSYRPPQ